MSEIVIIPRTNMAGAHFGQNVMVTHPEERVVKGHAVRAEVLAREINELGVLCKIGAEHITSDTKVIVMDCVWFRYVPDGVSTVFIDNGQGATYFPHGRYIDLYINGDGLSRGVDLPLKSNILSGRMFTILPDVDKVNEPYNDNAEYDFFIYPGGNPDPFWKKAGVVPVNSCCPMNLTHTEFLEEMRKSRVVVTTPSQTALEAMAMGKPVFLIKTSDDQEAIMHEVLDNDIAVKFISWEDTVNRKPLYPQLSLKAQKYMRQTYHGREMVANAIINLL